MSNEFDVLQKRLALNVRLKRVSLGLSQEALALLAGVDRTYIGQIERSQGNPSLRTLCKIADQCQVDLVTLLSQTD